MKNKSFYFPLCHCERSEAISYETNQQKQSQLMKKSAFTLAEVLITLAIIGVVAAMAIPSVISNAQQQEFKTGLRKAVSVLNSAITMNIALEGESPYDNGDLFRYLQRRMSVMKSTTFVLFPNSVKSPGGYPRGDYSSASKRNSAFYTTDGMRFEFYSYSGCNENNNNAGYPLHESNISTHMCTTNKDGSKTNSYKCGNYGLANNPNNTTATPYIITVDVNGDKKPYPANINATQPTENILLNISPGSKKVTDVFSIMVTEDRAVPFGVVAQKAMYQAQK